MEGAIEDGIVFELESSFDLGMIWNPIYSPRIVVQTAVSLKGDESHQSKLEYVRNLVGCCTGMARMLEASSQCTHKSLECNKALVERYIPKFAT
jgi:hypothetical protein